MCLVIHFPPRDVARNIGELTDILGGRPVCDESDPNNCCLCVVDVKATARKYRWKFKRRRDGDFEFTERYKKGGEK